MTKKIILTIAVLLLLTGSAFSAENLIITEDQLQALEPGREVSINRILDDGNLICVVGTGKGQDVRLIVVDSSTRKVIKSVDIPMKTVTYSASNADGSSVIVYSQFDAAFYLADMKTGKSRLLFKREKGKPGFGLYAERQSRMSFINGVAAAWGFFFDYKGQMDDEYIAFINPAKSGMDAFSKIIKTDRLRTIAKTYLHYAKAVGGMEINKQFLTFAPLSKDEGCLVAYEIASGTHYKIDSFRRFSGAKLSNKSPLLAYVIQKADDKSNEGTLCLYNLKTKKKIELDYGKLFKPVFSPSGKYLAVGKGVIQENKKLRTDIVIIHLDGKDYPKETITSSKNLTFLDWKFVKNDKCLMMFTGKDIYKTDLK